MTAPSSTAEPTVVLVHGAFAESASWNGVISRLLGRGHPVVAVANPLRGVRTDAAYLSSVLPSKRADRVAALSPTSGANAPTNTSARTRSLPTLLVTIPP